MKGLIDKVVTVYEMRADAMGILMANTQKALQECAPDGFDKEVKQMETHVKVRQIESDEALEETSTATRNMGGKNG